MAASNFEASLKLVLKHEGGYVDHPKDPGGATNLGVTIGTLSDWLGRRATKAEVRALTVATVAPIYRKNYWDRIGGDSLPAGLDFAVFDYAVNSGPSRALSHFRQTRISSTRVSINGLMDRRLAFLMSLPTWSTFGKGWGRRVKEVRAQALQMMEAAEKEKGVHVWDIGKAINDLAKTDPKTAANVVIAPPDVPPVAPPTPRVTFWSRIKEVFKR